MNKSVLKYNDGLDYMLTIEDSACKVVAARWKGAAISVGPYGFLKYDTVPGKVKYHADTIFISYDRETFNEYYRAYIPDSIFIVRDGGLYYPFKPRCTYEKYPYVKVSERQIKKQIRKLRKRPQYYIKGPED
ncbi:MAG: hypothetical protein J6M59_04000 [Bacteroidaceae bacterium]|nr:hypothetical protein [Bacteroidaceae bacterium]